MTLETFLRHLGKTPRRWSVDPDGQLRCAKGDCPLTAVYRLRAKRHNLTPDDFEIAALKLKVDFDASDVVYVADRKVHGEGWRRLRGELLKACGLSK